MLPALGIVATFAAGFLIPRGAPPASPQVEAVTVRADRLLPPPLTSDRAVRWLSLVGASALRDAGLRESVVKAMAPAEVTAYEAHATFDAADGAALNEALAKTLELRGGLDASLRERIRSAQARVEAIDAGLIDAAARALQEQTKTPTQDLATQARLCYAIANAAHSVGDTRGVPVSFVSPVPLLEAISGLAETEAATIRAITLRSAQARADIARRLALETLAMRLPAAEASATQAQMALTSLLANQTSIDPAHMQFVVHGVSAQGAFGPAAELARLNGDLLAELRSSLPAGLAYTMASRLDSKRAISPPRQLLIKTLTDGTPEARELATAFAEHDLAEWIAQLHTDADRLTVAARLSKDIVANDPSTWQVAPPSAQFIRWQQLEHRHAEQSRARLAAAKTAAKALADHTAPAPATAP